MNGHIKKPIILLIIVAIVAVGALYYLHTLKAGSGQNNIAQNTQQNNNHVQNTSKAVTFKCNDDKSVEATFYPRDDSHVDLTLSDGRSMNVPHAISASGARYANADESFVFWNKGDTAFITENGSTTYENCILPQTKSEPLSDTTNQSNMSFNYPQTLSTQYISTTDWPPKLQVTDQPYSCTQAGSKNAPAGRTEERMINGTHYCVTVESEGAAGSVYNQYAYAFDYQGSEAILTFSLRFVQCYNYDDPKQTECLQERNAFNIDPTVDAMARSLQTGASTQ